MITFSFNGLSFANDMRVNEISGRGITPSEVSTRKVPGMVGAHAGRKSRNVREITIKFTIVGNSLTNLRDKINLLSERLDLDEVAPLVFSDEPDKTYYAIMVNASDDDEIKTYGFGTLVFLCPDPYKYGPEMTATLNTDVGSIINVAGTAPTKPVIELTATAQSTFAMVANDLGEYNMIGAPVDVDVPKYTKYTPILQHGMNNVTNWTSVPANEVDHPIGGAVNSVLIGNDHYFAPNGFSNGTAWHGPAIKRALSEPLQSFKAEAMFAFNNTADKKMLGNLEMYLLDVNGQCVARIGLRDGSSGTADVFGQARIGPATGSTRKEMINTNGDRPGVWNNFRGFVRVEREGNKWTTYIAKIDSKGNHHTRKTVTWVDSKSIHTNPVTQVVFAFQQHGTAPVPQMLVSSINIFKINTPPNGATPYVIEAGDVIEFDHRGKSTYRINGADAKRLKNFGATNFTLKPGENIIAIEPGTVFTGTIKWRDAYK